MKKIIILVVSIKKIELFIKKKKNAVTTVNNSVLKWEFILYFLSLL